MRTLIYILRFIVALLFIYAGIEKLFLPYDPSVFKANATDCNPLFFQFYNLLQQTGYLFFVVFFQLLCGLLLVFKRTYILGSIMLTPLVLCLWATHIFISQNTFYIIFDSSILFLNIIILFSGYQKWKNIIQKTNQWI